MSERQLLMEMVAEIESLKEEINRLATMIPAFEILNQNTPSQITADQNNYDPGDYDTLLLSSSAAWDITGISGGVMGRVLTLINVGLNHIILRHEAGASTTTNRLVTPGSAPVFVVPGETVQLRYDSSASRWRVIEFGFSGTWTPTLTNVTNITGSTAAVCQYIKKGNVVACGGRVSIDPTAAGAAELGMSLPVDSDFTGTNQLGGTATPAAVAGVAVSVQSDATNNRASFQWIVVDTANRQYWFSFVYLLL